MVVFASSSTDIITVGSAVVAALAALAAAAAAGWTIKLTNEARQELINERRLERLVAVAREVGDLRWGAHADPWHLGGPLQTLVRVLPLAPMSVEEEKTVHEMHEGLEYFFDLPPNLKAVRAKEVEDWAKKAGDRLGADIRDVMEKLAKLEGG